MRVQQCFECKEFYPMEDIYNSDALIENKDKNYCISCLEIKFLEGLNNPKTICQCGEQMIAPFGSMELHFAILDKGIAFYMCPNHIALNNEFEESEGLNRSSYDLGLLEGDPNHDYIGIYINQPAELLEVIERVKIIEDEVNFDREYIYDAYYWEWYKEGSKLFNKKYREDWKEFI